MKKAVIKKKNDIDNTKKSAVDTPILKKVISTSLDGFFISDLQGKFIDANNAYCNMIGYTKKKLCTMKIADIEGIETSKMIEQRKKRIMSKGFEHFETKHRRKDTQIIDIETNVSYLREKKLFSCFVKNITEKKRDTENAKKSIKEWENTFNAITDLISIHDTSFNILRVNKAFSDYVQKKPKYLIGKKCYQIIHCTKEPIAECPLKITLNNGKSTIKEFYEPKLKLWVEVSTNPIFENNKICGAIHIIKNIDTRKKAEKKLEEQVDMLRRFKDSTVDQVIELQKFEKENIVLKKELKKYKQI